MTRARGPAAQERRLRLLGCSRMGTGAPTATKPWVEERTGSHRATERKWRALQDSNLRPSA